MPVLCSVVSYFTGQYIPEDNSELHSATLCFIHMKAEYIV